jgi:glycosyltransferase involved in cell wall biosynthesis
MAELPLPDALNRIGADSVYMLLHPGWSREARANRWHFAVRWARHLPVVLVIPETAYPWHCMHAEQRIANCSILDVVANGGRWWSGPAQVQTAQILEHMRIRGHRRPLLWLYNAFFTEAYAALPAIARVHHVTENYFDFPAMSPLYLDRLKVMSRISDLNVAVSEGCASPIRDGLDNERMLIATNGCDFSTYGADVDPDPGILAFRSGFRRVAVFAGNINDRLDFGLLNKAAHGAPDTLLLLVGNENLAGESAGLFQKLMKQPNVRATGPVNPDRLPAIYRAVDFGVIPYERTRLIVENGFPLKALEMAAAGLPVVSTMMKPLLAISPPLTVTRNEDEFLKAYRDVSTSRELKSALRVVAAANDYDARFAAIVSTLAQISRVTGWRADALPDKFAKAGSEQAYEHFESYRRSPLGVIQGMRYRMVAPVARLLGMLPTPMRENVRRLKRYIFNGIKTGTGTAGKS